MVVLPDAEQLAATDVIVGTAGVGNCAPLLNETDDADVHPPFVDVTV